MRSKLFAAALLAFGLPCLAQTDSQIPFKSTLAAKAANSVGTAVDTSAFSCVSLQAKAATSAVADVQLKQSVDGSMWTPIGAPLQGLTSTPVLITAPGANYTRADVENYVSGTITAVIGKTAACNPQAGVKTQAAVPTAGADITDGTVFVPAVTACVADSANLAVTRTAANDWSRSRTAGGAETYNVRCELGSWLQRATASSGIKITGLKIVSKIGVVDLTSATLNKVSKTAYVNNVANAVTDFGGTITATLPTVVQTHPYVTPVTLGAPAYFTSADSSLGIDLTYVLANTGTLDLYGIAVLFTRTNP